MRSPTPSPTPAAIAGRAARRCSTTRRGGPQLAGGRLTAVPRSSPGRRQRRGPPRQLRRAAASVGSVRVRSDRPWRVDRSRSSWSPTRPATAWRRSSTRCVRATAAPAATSCSPTTARPTGRPSRPRRARPASGCCRTGGNIGYGAAANVGARGSHRRSWLVVANPDVRLGRRARSTSCWPRPSAGRARARSARLIRTPDGELYPSARELPVAGPRHRACAARLVCGRATRGPRAYRRGAQAPRRATGRLAVRLLPAGAPRGVRLGRRVRPELLHVLRGHRPGRAAAAAPAGRTSTCRRAVVTHVGGHATERGPPRGCSPSTTAAPTATSRGSMPGRRWAPVRLGAAHRPRRPRFPRHAQPARRRRRGAAAAHLRPRPVAVMSDRHARSLSGRPQPA